MLANDFITFANSNFQLLNLNRWNHLNVLKFQIKVFFLAIGTRKSDRLSFIAKCSGFEKNNVTHGSPLSFALFIFVAMFIRIANKTILMPNIRPVFVL